MNNFRLITIAVLACLISACADEAPPPRTVDEFLESSFLLDAAIVRCAQERSKTKYDQECINAREATNRLATVDREARRIDLEAQSARKRRALRRTQQAATEARRRAAEARRLREQEEYLGLFETIPENNTGDSITNDDSDSGMTAPVANRETLPATQPQATTSLPEPQTESLPGNQPGAVLSPPPPQKEAETEIRPEPEPTDIESIREELKRRQDSSG